MHEENDDIRLLTEVQFVHGGLQQKKEAWQIPLVKSQHIVRMSWIWIQLSVEAFDVETNKNLQTSGWNWAGKVG